MEDHTYYLAQEKARERQSSSVKKQKRDEAKRKRERRRQKTRINIGVAFPRWKSLMTDRRFQSDAEVACFLLDSFEKLPASLTSVNGKPVHVRTLGSPGGTRSVSVSIGEEENGDDSREPAGNPDPNSPSQLNTDGPESDTSETEVSEDDDDDDDDYWQEPLSYSGPETEDKNLF
ncbi:uncharacterized protein [Embiotoca jacksoni]|uniref:uncharacterized protein isoform X1 n=1 Tax=Embiotoca jacksoni TaxID=100190 RepID=UPI003703B7E9